MGIVWNGRVEETWEDGFAALTKFKGRNGHCRVPSCHIEGRFKLGQWVKIQRSSAVAISPERRKLLDALEFIWDPIQSAWEEGFAALKTFRAREGHCLVPRDYVEGGYKLGQWVAVQRYSENIIYAERRRRLDAIGFVWNWREYHWEYGFAALTKFQALNGHCRVPSCHIEGRFKLGQWVSTQRRKKDTISAERRKRLNDIGFVWRLRDDAARDFIFPACPLQKCHPV